MAALAGGWFYAAHRLWQTSVPDDLKLPRIDISSFVSADELERAEHFSLVLGLFGLCGLILPLVVLALYAKFGHRFIGESAAGPIGTGMLLAMLGLGFVWMAMLPRNLATLWWLRRYGIAKTDYGDYIVGTWLVLGSEFLGICLVILIVMGFARLLGNRWWLVGAPVFVGVVALFVFLQPYTMRLQPMKDHPELVEAKDRLAEEEGVGDVPLKVIDAAGWTTAPNAEAMGLGPSRRIALWDTMLDGRFSKPELEVVIAHELAHHKHNDLWKGLAWFALFSFPIAYLIALVTKRRGGMTVPGAVPLFLFIWFAFPIATLPIDNELSRRIEAEADWTALEATRDPEGAQRLFENFIRTTHEDPDPPLWDVILFGSHPSASKRIAMTLAWRARSGG